LTEPGGVVGRRSLASYIKSAFLTRWNMLLFFGAGVAAALSPWPDALLPMVAAGELAYLAGIVSRPRFRQAIDAQNHAARRGASGPQKARVAKPALIALLNSLPPNSRRRFESLRAHCLEMSRIAEGVRGQPGAQTRADELRTPALDRLLWVFLRLLAANRALERFIENTDENELTTKLQDLRGKLETAQQNADERVKMSLQDSVNVAEMRLANYRKAASNAQFVELELDRIEAKIQALVEMSVNRQDPDFLTDQVDAAADSMKQTETAISELQSITGLTDVLEEPPPILDSDLRDTIGNHA